MRLDFFNLFRFYLFNNRGGSGSRRNRLEPYAFLAAGWHLQHYAKASFVLFRWDDCACPDKLTPSADHPAQLFVADWVESENGIFFVAPVASDEIADKLVGKHGFDAIFICRDRPRESLKLRLRLGKGSRLPSVRYAKQVWDEKTSSNGKVMPSAGPLVGICRRGILDLYVHILRRNHCRPVASVRHRILKRRVRCRAGTRGHVACRLAEHKACAEAFQVHSPEVNGLVFDVPGAISLSEV